MCVTVWDGRKKQTGLENLKYNILDCFVQMEKKIEN